MYTRLRFLFLAVLAALVGAAFELQQLTQLRPWLGATFVRTGVELAVLWTAATAGLALIALLVLWRRSPPACSAFALAPLAWSCTWVFANLDPRGHLSTPVVVGVAAALLAASLWLFARLMPLLARLRWLGLPLLPFTVVLLLTAWAAFDWYRAVPRARPHGSRASTAATAAPAKATNVLWISIDTLRADRVGAYGNQDGLTPTLDALAREGVVFEDATCPLPLTMPSHVAMLTGLPPNLSGVHKNGVPLPANIDSLPRELANQEGYLTAAFVSGFPLFERSSRLAEHFHHYDDEADPDAPLTEGTRATPFGNLGTRVLRNNDRWREPIERSGDLTASRALAWLDENGERGTPWFVFLHFYDVHGEDVPHKPGVKRTSWASDSLPKRLRFLQNPANRRQMEQLYDGEVEFADAQAGKVIAQLRARGLLDRTLVIATSDHGESLGEHEFWYEHINPYHIETHVPLILRLPGGESAGTRVKGPAELTDLAATVRDLLGVSIDVPGSSLVSSIGTQTIPRHLVFCQSMFDFSSGSHAVSVRDGQWKLLRRSESFQICDSRRIPGGEYLFDVLADPGETNDLIASGAVPEAARIDELRTALDEYEKECVAAGPDVIDPEIAENLRKLGYVK